MTRRIQIVLAVMFLCSPLSLAKRVSPKPVVPVIYQGVKYSADGDGRVQFVIATEIATGKSLWKVKIFRTHIKPWIEEDNQWVFITDPEN